MQALFRDQEITGGAAELRSLLEMSDLWDVHQLRAVTILQQRIFDQLQVLYTTQTDMEAIAHGAGTDIRATTYRLAMKLRQLEFELLERAYEWFEGEVRTTCPCCVETRWKSSPDLLQGCFSECRALRVWWADPDSRRCHWSTDPKSSVSWRE